MAALTIAKSGNVTKDVSETKAICRKIVAMRRSVSGAETQDPAGICDALHAVGAVLKVIENLCGKSQGHRGYRVPPGGQNWLRFSLALTLLPHAGLGPRSSKFGG